jgi:GxxExxY protein
MKGLAEEPLTYRTRGALFRAHSILGPDVREETYRRAAIRELEKQGMEALREKKIEIRYANRVIDRCRLDIVVEGKIILELKAVDGLAKVHESQLLSYVNASGLTVGLLVNFGEASLQIKRRVN